MRRALPKMWFTMIFLILGSSLFLFFSSLYVSKMFQTYLENNIFYQNLTLTPPNRREYYGNVTYDSFFYIHVPRTGTSLYTLLRNYLPSCTVKDFTCLNYRGGGLLADQALDSKDHFPFTAKSLNLHDDAESVNNCDGALNCNIISLHYCPYANGMCRRRKNKVTMFREPHRWFSSYFDWLWISRHSRNDTSFNVKEIESPMNFVTGTFDIDEAFRILHENYVWWGVTDYWEVSVCLFHCEIGVGGGSRDSELLNFRSSQKMKNATLMETELDPKFYRKAYIPNMTAYVEETYSHDIKFYNLKILPAFYRRASKCGCTYHGH